MWAKMSLYNTTIYQPKGMISGRYKYKKEGLPGQESGGVIARAPEPEYLKQGMAQSKLTMGNPRAIAWN